MYQVFDRFLTNETWSSMHDLDVKRFNEALSEVVENDDFHPDTMGDYFVNKLNIDTADDEGLISSVRSYVGNAHAVRDYLKAVNS